MIDHSHVELAQLLGFFLWVVVVLAVHGAGARWWEWGFIQFVVVGL